MKVYYYIGSSGSIYLDPQDLESKHLSESEVFIDTDDIETINFLKNEIRKQHKNELPKSGILKI